jgi:hypothetical protein
MADLLTAYAHGKGRQPESYIRDAIRAYLRAHGWFVVRMQQGLGCHRGIADLCAMRDGRTVWVEAKTATGKQSDYQAEFERCVLAAAGEYRLARSIEDVADL